jgi:DNA-3-methyladenine glycosylase II
MPIGTITGRDLVGAMDIITISSAADIDRAVAQLNIPQFNAIHEKCSPIPLRRKPPGFASLLQAIIGQQVSVASAAAIWERIQAAGLCCEAAMAQASTEDLARLGLSRPKIRYGKALAMSGLDYEGLAALSDAEVLSRLTAITGIGRWTAEVYALQALGRADVFPHGDLALQEAARQVFHLPERPSEADMRALAENWAPFRAVAARLLWAYYKDHKSREGIG